ncbi:DUF2849 domain-containing protein [Telmatospirillum sp. J64-1]|uniref:DUF2849 domain-containing protein n=1 Tax=Telmatospirillum sp. J64-1 TaxID=2502183 RepID=UPI00163D3FA8|nr:DUF2849 domain-containing protein [Telmatospirillum sp. J64-1]
MTTQIVTANRLHDGLVVFRVGESWTQSLSEAQTYTPEEAAALVARIEAEEKTQVVGVYAVEIDDAKVPTKGRERIRALGPTVRPDISKQVEA